ncbi:AcrR family transcriptional regulator [Rhodococcus sp. PvR044]|uniref:TetR/AcrR family transcriptional regulator n=1 Tax=Rhodococcus TaxID=1827 RepID=UPI001AE4E77B|nr:MULTISPECIES: TetR/AcrR family transcriptional regulator [Rhodococcus]MBP1162051.1 AcrR family transcriptional regulator [Rhodococcus sp. PvR099]MCZ4557806.1 TetR/AcrR family transcriptional regulator [Rhodococcus maanshanensis]
MAGPTAAELLWGVPQAPRRGPKPSLTLDRIVAEAIALADAEGLANLSMARLAERLGCAKMALYRYVPGKSELAALMLDTAFGPAPEVAAALPDSPEPWREYLAVWAVTAFNRYRAHPWALELTTGPRPIGPNELNWLETALAALDGSSLTGPERLDSAVLLLGHVRSLVQQVGSATEDDDTEGQLAREIGAILTAHGDSFPRVAAAFADQAEQTDPNAGRNDALRFGIDRILDGIAAYVSARK